MFFYVLTISLDKFQISNHFLNKFMYLCIPIDKLLISEYIMDRL
jgi:hypothetical protein